MAVGLISQRQNSPIHLSFVNIGSLVENYDISIFRSWTGVRRLVREEFKRLASDFKDISSIDIVVSSILSVTELIARPYVLGTDNDPRYWLKPQDLAKRVKAIILKRKDGFRQYKIFHKAPGVSHDRFKESEMVKRRLFEHYGLIKSEPRKKFK
ncbi:MAG: hypothetical protein UY19_C0014G0096 [Candidatus Wolfebacteria bacterium GW2011_GWA2_47_9b]|nr:MAG: hypothetical protein UY19_C0014G0096 [Candidatus Wolfebacteria bacterium GW2011_GWA2_47_9b]